MTRIVYVPVIEGAPQRRRRRRSHTGARPLSGGGKGALSVDQVLALRRHFRLHASTPKACRAYAADHGIAFCVVYACAQGYTYAGVVEHEPHHRPLSKVKRVSTWRVQQ